MTKVICLYTVYTDLNKTPSFENLFFFSQDCPSLEEIFKTFFQRTKKHVPNSENPQNQKIFSFYIFSSSSITYPTYLDVSKFHVL